MRKYLLSLVIPLAIAVTLCLSPKASGEVNINIGINAPPPAVVIVEPPSLVVISGTYIYFIPDRDDDIFFYHGYWYRPYRGRWHRAGDYNGPWVFISISRVPRVLINIHPGFRGEAHGHERMPWGHVKKSWKRWEQDRHWEGPDKRKHNEHNGRGKGKGKHRGD